MDRHGLSQASSSNRTLPFLSVRRARAAARSRPLASASAKPAFQLGAVAVAAYFLYWLLELGLQLAGGGSFGADAPLTVRLRVLGLRDPALPLSAANNVTFGLLSGGCPMAPSQQ